MTNKNLSKSDIKQNIWTLNQKMSEPDNPIYTHTFPIKRYGKSVILLGEFIKDKSGKISVNVYNNSTGELYSPYYYHEYGNYKPIISKIDKAIVKEFERIKAYADDSNV